MKTVILAEKPDEAEKIANALELKKVSRKLYKGTSALFPNTQISLVSARGHLFTLKEPEEHDSKWKREKTFDTYKQMMDKSLLPILPSTFEFKPTLGAKEYFDVIKTELKDADNVIISTDPDREGENIARIILKQAKFKGKDIKRAWPQSVTKDGLIDAFTHLKNGNDTYPLYLEARARQLADWIFGMTMSRGVSALMTDSYLLGDKKFPPKNTGGWSIGRVQTAVVVLIARLEDKINNWPEPFPKVYKPIVLSEYGDEFSLDEPIEFKNDRDSLLFLEELSDEAEVVVSETEKFKQAPELFEANTLKKYMFQNFDWTSKKTGDVYQGLYEKGYLSYPRTDSHFISEKEFDYLVPIAKKIQNAIDINFDLVNMKPRKYYVDESKVTGHYATIPTDQVPDLNTLSEDEKTLYKVVATRTIAMFSKDWQFNETMIKLNVEYNEGKTVIFSKKAIKTTDNAWRDILKDKKKDSEFIGDYKNGEIISINKKSKEIEKKPPKRLTEATLLSVLKKVGIGTPATTDNLIESLINPKSKTYKGYLKLIKKEIFLSEKGRTLYDSIGDIVSPETTKQWEEDLKKIGKGEEITVDEFIKTVTNKSMEQLSLLSQK